MKPLISVSQALAHIKNTAAAINLGQEIVPIRQANNRVCADEVKANTTLPPLDASAMDGYAIIANKDHTIGSHFRLIGQSPAGTPFEGTLGDGECVRIFTGGSVPSGATHVVIQENVSADATGMALTHPISPNTNIRKAGIDFSQGEIILKSGQIINGYGCGLLAAAGHSTVLARKKPVIALIANGDELVEPDGELREGSIISSNPYGLAPLLRAWGADIIFAGISKDDPDAITAQIKSCQSADVLLPIGGASVGDRDFMRPVFDALGYTSIFTKVAVKPGKPIWFGSVTQSGKQQLVMGLPGNPASALVCASVFVKPLIESLLRANSAQTETNAALTKPLGGNSWRTDYLRAFCQIDDQGQQIVTPFPRQDSSLITPFLSQNCLIVRPPEDTAKQIGDLVKIMKL